MSTIDKLIERMTLAEKLGQLTMTSSSYAVTGPVIVGDSTDSIRDGTLGNLLNMVGAKHVHDMQRIAVEESRLGIPLLIGFDVIHGHRTIFPVPLAEAATFDPAHLGAHGTRSRSGNGGRRNCDDVRADARCLARSSLGPNRRRAGRGSMARGADRSRESPRFPGRRSRAARLRGRDGQTLLRLRPRGRWARLCVGRYLRAHAARSASAGIRSGRSRRRSGDHAGVHRSRGHSDDGAQSAAARLPARRARLRRRARQRLQRDSRAHPSRRGGRHRRGSGARAEGGRGHRHDGGVLSQGSAGRARARARDDGRDRRVRAPGAASQGTSRTVRRSLSARLERGGGRNDRRPPASGARRRREVARAREKLR